jgi:hypothetical protein
MSVRGIRKGAVSWRMRGGLDGQRRTNELRRMRRWRYLRPRFFRVNHCIPDISSIDSRLDLAVRVLQRIYAIVEAQLMNELIWRQVVDRSLIMCLTRGMIYTIENHFSRHICGCQLSAIFACVLG